MKSNFLRLSYFAIAAAGMLTACNQENVSSDMANSGNVLSISVSQNDFSPVDAESRAVTDLTNRKTTFENGDKLGLYVVSNADGSYHYENVPFTYNEGAWTSTSTIYYYKNSDYIVYYPYDENLQLTVGETGVSGAIKTVFENKADFYTQNTADAYEAVDLMMAEVENPSAANVNFNLAHKFSMIEISVPVRKYITERTYNGEKFEYNAPVKLEWTSPLAYGDNEVTPYAAGKGVYRFIVKPGTDVAVNIDGYVQYEEEPFNFSNNNAALTLTEGSFKHYKVTVDGISNDVTVRDLKVGDYYYSDGSIYPYGDQTGEHDLKNPMVEGCIGVIFEVGTTLQVDDSNTKEINSGIEGTIWNHASVLALTDAGSAKWSTAKKSIAENIYADFTGNLPFTVDGYKYTYEYQKLGLNENDALRKVTSFGGTEYIAPASSSGWYMPSVGQFVLILNNLGGGMYKDFMVEPTTGNRGNRKTLMSNVENKLKIVNASAKVSGLWLFANEKDINSSWAYESDINGSSKEYFLSRPKANAYRYWAVLSF